MKSVVLISHKEGFSLAHVTGGTALGFKFETLPKPMRHAGRLYSWRVLYGQLNERGEVVKLLKIDWLPAKSETEAYRLFKGIIRNADIHNERRLEAKRKPPTARSRAIHRAQLKALAKNFRRTCEAFAKLEAAGTVAEREALRLELWRAYTEETAIACDGSPVVEPVTTRDALKRIAAGLEAARKRVESGPDLAVALVLGCMAKEYDRLPLNAIVARLEGLHGFKKLTPDAVRQCWKRLGLPNARTRGRK